MGSGRASAPERDKSVGSLVRDHREGNQMIATTARRRRQPVAPPTPAAPAEPKLGPQPRAVEAATDQGPDRPAQVARSGALRPATIASGLTGAQRNEVHENPSGVDYVAVAPTSIRLPVSNYGSHRLHGPFPDFAGRSCGSTRKALSVARSSTATPLNEAVDAVTRSPSCHDCGHSQRHWAYRRAARVDAVFCATSRD